MARKTTEIFKKEVKDIWGDEYSVLEDYINNKTNILVIHNKCGNKYRIRPLSLIQGTRCAKCYGNKKKTTEEFKEEVYNLVKDEYEVIGNYTGALKEITMKHNKCGRIYSVRANSFLDGSRCHNCYVLKMTKTQNEFLEEIYNLVGNEYTVIGNYINNSTNIEIIHNECNHKFMVTPANFTTKNSRCPKCGAKSSILKRTKTHYKFVQEVFKLEKDNYTVIGNYKNSNSKIKIRHNDCGETYEVVPNNFLRGKRCPKCSKSKQFSNAEKELLDYITSTLPEDTEILFNVRNIISPKELDIYIPSLNIAFEYNGLYWHTEEYLDKNYHLDKTNECNKKGIKLIHIFEDEWLNNQGLMKKKIANLLGVNNKADIKDYYIKEIKDNSDLIYKLYTKDNKLLSALTLCKTKKDGVYELLNYESNYNEVDDLNMILKYIKSNNNDVNKIYVYADLRFVDKNDNIYLKNGFKFVSQSRPNYWYVVNGERKEIVNKDSYYKIYDCGKLKYEIDMK